MKELTSEMNMKHLRTRTILFGCPNVFNPTLLGDLPTDGPGGVDFAMSSHVMSC